MFACGPGRVIDFTCWHTVATRENNCPVHRPMEPNRRRPCDHFSPLSRYFRWIAISPTAPTKRSAIDGKLASPHLLNRCVPSFPFFLSDVIRCIRWRKKTQQTQIILEKKLISCSDDCRYFEFEILPSFRLLLFLEATGFPFICSSDGRSDRLSTGENVQLTPPVVV